MSTPTHCAPTYWPDRVPTSRRPTKIDEVKITLRTGGHNLPVNVIGACVGPANVSSDRRLRIKIHEEAYAQAVARSLFGLTPALLPDPPLPDSHGNVIIELRVTADVPEPIGTSAVQLRQWVAALTECTPDDIRLDAASWLVSGVGGPAAASPITPTLWHYLPDLSIGLDGAPDTATQTAMESSIEAAVSYLTDAVPNDASALGFDVAGQLLNNLLLESQLDPGRAIEILRRDLVSPQTAVNTDLLSLAHAVLLQEGTSPSVAASGAALVYPIDGDNGSWHGVIEERMHDVIIVYSLVPVELPVARVVELLELTVRLNRDLGISNFDLDLDGGDFALRTGIDLRTSNDPAESIRHAIHANAETLDDHLGAIEAFIAGASVADSIALLASPASSV
jgi:hypothetical protein